MSKFNNVGTKATVFSPVTSTGAKTVNHQGGTGYLRDAKSELFLLAVTNMVGESTFYEKASDRDDRFSALVRTMAVEDFSWLSDMLGWLRGEGNLRSASLVGAAVAVHERIKHGLYEGNANLISSVLQRADEPGEMLAFWRSTFGRSLPKPVKKGVANAVLRLYGERAYLKWDSDARGYRMADVIETVSPQTDAEHQNLLFKYMLDERHHKDGDLSVLYTLSENARWRRMAAQGDSLDQLLNPSFIRIAGLTWEDVLSGLGSKADKKLLWEAVIPSMGYMALLRNLRNFDESGVSDLVAEGVIAKLTDPFEVAKSRQLPMRFYSAYRAAPSLRWGYALEKALEMTLANVPELPGRTLVLVDTSGSMRDSFSRDGKVLRWDAATLFGVALARRCASVDVVSFSSAYWGGEASKVFPLKRGESLLSSLKRWNDGGWFIGGGTDTAEALRAHFKSHDRVVILTDEQADDDTIEVSKSIPDSVPLYTWNLAGYKAGHAPAGERNRHTFGGLTDAAFTQIALLENLKSGAWPWAS
jgi:hypothetical protein